MNSIENLKQYKISGIADKILGLAPTDSVAERKFREIFQPNFSIRNYPAKQLLHLTKSFPVAYYIRNDTIAARFSGELPCAYVLKEVLQKIK
jgi:hypothetical protein